MRSTSTIRAIAHALPATTLTYEDLAARFGEKHVASIYRMSGIRDRRVVAPGQCASDLAVAAARRLIEHSGVDPAGIDALIFVSQTPDYRIPATATRLQAELGLPEKCATFDVNQACASFIFGLQIAHSMVVAETARRVLLLNADALSTLINPNDRGLVTIHGDAAVATLVEPCDAQSGGIEFFEVGAAGKDFDRLIVPAGGRVSLPGRRRASRKPTPPAARAARTSCSWMVRRSFISHSTRSRISSKNCSSGGTSRSTTSISSCFTRLTRP